MTLPLRRAGAALVVLYALVAVATHLLSGGAGRPLFDGFGPPPPYNWANPPPEFALGNFPPQSAERIVPLGEAGSEPTNASTPDAQIIIGLPRGTLPAHPPDTAVALRIVPRDAGQLGPLPPNLRVVANAYQVTLNYQPSQEPVTSVVTQGATVAMTAATQSDTFLYSVDGREWRVEPSRPFGNTHGLIGGFLGAGYYLVAASPAVENTSGPSDTSSGSGPFLVALVAVVVVGGIGFAVVMVRRRRAAAAASAAARRRKPKPKHKGH